MATQGKSGLPSFIISTTPKTELRDKWIKWIRYFELQIQLEDSERLKNGSERVDPATKKLRLLTSGGLELQETYYGLLESSSKVDLNDTIQEKDEYQAAKSLLDEHFAPKVHEIYARHLFCNLKPTDDETLVDFSKRVATEANSCNFGKTAQEAREMRVIDTIVSVAPPDLKEKLLQYSKPLTLDYVLKKVKTFEAVKNQAQKIGKSVSTSILDVNKMATPKLCTFCGNDWHVKREHCPAYGKQCKKCGGFNHFANKCRSKFKTDPPQVYMRYQYGGQNQHSRPFKSARRVEYDSEPEAEERPVKKRKVQRVEDQSIQESSDEEPEVNILSVSWCEEEIEVNIGGVAVKMFIDSGSKCNLIDENTWKDLQLQRSNFILQAPSSKVLVGYGRNQLETLAVFEAEIDISFANKKVTQLAKFYVIKGAQQSLLGSVTSKKLGILKVGLHLLNSENVANVTGSKIFPCIKGIKVKLPIDKNVPPVQQPLRRTPIALVKQFDETLNETLEQGIIEKVDYSSWISPTVPVIKKNGELRLCVDMRRANEAILRAKHPLPTVDELLAEIKNARYFTLIDIKQAFFQCELDEDSRYITTFMTHRGLYRFTRLTMGVNCAPEIFQQIMTNIIRGIPNCVNYIDDLLLWGETSEEHDKTYKEVMKRLTEHGVVVNTRKCQIKQKSVQFLGHNLSESGIKASEDKIQALKSCEAPKTKEELRSFLGLASYIQKFIPDFATLSEPLWKATRTEEKFYWDETRNKAFQEMKKAMSEPSTLGFYDPTKKTRLIADASPVGLGAVLIQFHDAGPRIIAYASKSLSQTERRYCQTEKEALALVWACERFRHYIFGIDFELETDHQPLEAIFKPTSRPCARIERWVLRLQSFRFKVVYRCGKANLADPLSRLPKFDPSEESFDEECELLIRVIEEAAALDVCEIETASKDDHEMQAIRSAIQTNDWSAVELKDYRAFKDEYVMSGYLVLRGNKLVMPESLRGRMLELAHEGHPGETLMRTRLRQRCWWPRLDHQASNFVKACRGCQLTSVPDRPEPMSRKPLPNKAWEDIAIDYLGPIESEYVLVVVDYYSRYLEAKCTKKITAAATIDLLDEIFTRLGYPRTITLDNARQFISPELENWCKKRGIELVHTIPYWPQANGECERQNRTLLKRLRIANALYGDWKVELRNFLHMYYSTKHCTTDKTPTELMFGRTIRTKLPSIDDLQCTPFSESFRDRDKTEKLKGKEREDGRRKAKASDIKVGDTVLCKNLLPGTKLTTPMDKTRYKVTEKNGPAVTITNPDTGATYLRSSGHIKKVPAVQTTPEGLIDLSGVETTLCGNQPTGNPTQDTVSRESRNDQLPTRTRQKPSWMKDFI